MSRYIVTNGSSFEPFTYEQLAVPSMQMTEAQNAVQEAYDAMSMDTEVLGRYISENEGDDKVRGIYNDYLNQLKELQNDLWSKGFNASTMRGLSRARSSYAKGITGIKDAIDRRQKIAKAISDAQRDDRTLLIGDNPSSHGLDEFYDNPSFGENWYSYSGSDFEKSVGDEIGNRAQEFLRGLTGKDGVVTNPALAGYYTRILNHGVTNDEINRAGFVASALVNMTPEQRELALAALENAEDESQRINPIESLVAGVLLNRLDQTGAIGNLSDDDISKLMSYGISGASKGVMKPDVKDFKMDTANGGGGGGTNPTGPVVGRYALPSDSVEYSTPDAAKTDKRINDLFYGPYQDDNGKASPVILNNPDQYGSAHILRNESDAEDFFAQFGRNAIMNRFGGLDPMNPYRHGLAVDGNGNTAEVRLKVNYDESDKPNHFDPEVSEAYEDFYGAGLSVKNYEVQRKDKNGKWITDPVMTNDFNARAGRFNQSVEAWKKANPTVDFDKLVVTGKDLSKLRRDYNIPDSIPTQDIPVVVAAMTKRQNMPESVIASASDDAATAAFRKSLVSIMLDRYIKASSVTGIEKGSPDAFYDVKKGGYTKDGKGKASINDVFATKSTGNGKDNITIDPTSLLSVGALAEDIQKGLVRLTTTKGQFLVDAAYLGDDYRNLFSMFKSDGNKPGAAETLLRPLEDPVWAIRANGADLASWKETVDLITSGFVDLSRINPEDVVRNDSVRSLYRKIIIDFFNDVLAYPRDYMMHHPFQKVDSSSSKPKDFNS